MWPFSTKYVCCWGWEDIYSNTCVVLYIIGTVIGIHNLRMSATVVSGLNFFVAWKKRRDYQLVDLVQSKKYCGKEYMNWNFVKGGSKGGHRRKDSWTSSWRSKDPLGREGSVCIWAASIKACLIEQQKRLSEWPVILIHWKLGCCGVAVLVHGSAL